MGKERTVTQVGTRILLYLSNAVSSKGSGHTGRKEHATGTGLLNKSAVYHFVI